MIDSECIEGLFCLRDVCSMPGIPGDFCLIDSQCMVGLNCVNNECTEPVLPPGEKGDQGTVYRLLKMIGKKDFKKAPVNTNITTNEFKEHFKKVSTTKFENDPVY